MKKESEAKQIISFDRNESKDEDITILFVIHHRFRYREDCLAFIVKSNG